MIPRKQSLAIIVIGLLVVMSGCEEAPNERLSTLSERYAERQAEQSRQTVALQQEVAAGSRELVTADAQARQELVTIQRELHNQRAALDQQRDLLEQERQELAVARYWEPLLEGVIDNLGLIVVSLLPLLICWLLLQQKEQPASDQEVAELLLSELVSSNPLLGSEPPPPLLTGQQIPERHSTLNETTGNLKS